MVDATDGLASRAHKGLCDENASQSTLSWKLSRPASGTPDGNDERQSRIVAAGGRVAQNLCYGGFCQHDRVTYCATATHGILTRMNQITQAFASRRIDDTSSPISF